MKNFPLSKKRKLSSRTLADRTHNLDNFQETIQKQLKDDFKVHQYLTENPIEANNTQQYIALFNKLLVRKRNKIKKKQLLESSKAQFESKTTPSESGNDPLGASTVVDFYYSEEEYQAIKQQSEEQQDAIEVITQQEMDMKRILHKEITEKKKSLDLLKGDIGHMITRNESISVLESKVNKVSLVSENQLKRVSMALNKDWDEVQQRQDMQKRFHQKLKYVESVQRRNLKKIKNSYIEGMRRKKQIHDKLLMIEKQCASIDEYSDKQRQYKEKNLKTKETYELLQKLCQLINKSRDLFKSFTNKEIDLQIYSGLIKRQFYFLNAEKDKTSRSRVRSNATVNFKLTAESGDLVLFNVDQISEQELDQFCENILGEFENLETQIHEKKKHYNSLVRRIEEMCQIMSNLDLKRASIVQNFHEDERLTLNQGQNPLQGYIETFKQLQKNIRTLCLLLTFLSKKLQGEFEEENQSYASKIYSNCLFHCQIAQMPEQSMHSEAQKWEIASKLKDFLHKFHPDIFESIRQKLPVWFQKLYSKLFEKTSRLNPVQLSHRNFLTSSNLNMMIQESGRDQNTSRLLNDEKIECEEEEGQLKQNFSELNTSCAHRMGVSTGKGSLHLSMIKNKTDTGEMQCAKRVMLLQDIDQNYYRMIKETLEMEKENTRKNYEFKKNFKRTKYSSQDELLEQKRFEASFSGLFKQREDFGKNAQTRRTQHNSSSKASKFIISTPFKKMVSSLHSQSHQSLLKNGQSTVKTGTTQKLKNKSTMIVSRKLKKQKPNKFMKRAETAKLCSSKGKKKLSQKLKILLHEI